MSTSATSKLGTYIQFYLISTDVFDESASEKFSYYIDTSRCLIRLMQIRKLFLCVLSTSEKYKCIIPLT